MNRLNNRIFSLVLVGVALLCTLPAAAQFNVSIFDYPGSTQDSYTTLNGVNDAHVIVGVENSSGRPQGFLRRPDGSAITVTVPAPNGDVTQGAILSGINNEGQMVGQALSANGSVFHRTAFLMYRNEIRFFSVPGALGTAASAINDRGMIVGFYLGSDFNQHGFTRDRTGHLTLLDIQGSLSTVCYGINNRGQIVGYYSDEMGIYHGFLRNESGAITTIDMPGATYTTVAAGINDHGEIVGWGDVRGFVRSAVGTFRFFDVGPDDTFCSAINNRGTIVGGEDDDFTTHGLTIQRLRPYY